MKVYESWEELVADTANGWVAVAIVSRGKESWPWVTGPYPTKQEANRARGRLRHKLKREIRNHECDPDTTAKFFVRPCWKGTD